jgi:hypothetical protein
MHIMTGVRTKCVAIRVFPGFNTSCAQKYEDNKQCGGGKENPPHVVREYHQIAFASNRAS